jgi:hypothetical protein
MEKIDFVCHHLRAMYMITDGPAQGKFTFIREVDIASNTIVSKGGTVFPIEHIVAVLRTVEDMTDVEALIIYRLYWKHEKADDWSGDNGSANFKPRKVTPTKEHALRIFTGQDFSQGDYEEWMLLLPFLIKNDFDVLGGIGKGWAIKKSK